MNTNNNVYSLRLHDMNGKEVFSNSKIKYEDYEGRIFYSVDKCAFMILWNDGSIRDMNSQFVQVVEVME